MPTYRYPALLVQDAAAGAFTALPIDAPDGLAGFGPTPAAAVEQVREFLAWTYRRTGSIPEPDFLDAELSLIKVTVRPEYRVGSRIEPSPHPLLLRVPCVHGRQASRQPVAALPLLGLRFTYHTDNALKGLVVRYTQQRLEGKTPQELSRFLMPAQVSLAEVVVHLPAQAAAPPEAEALPTLAQVAEPLGARAVRRQFNPAWERDAELATLVRKLCHEPAHLLLAGEPGVGKTALLVEAVRTVERDPGGGERPRGPRAARFWQTGAARLIAGMKYLGQWEARCEAVIAELSTVDGVLCVDRLLDLVRTGGTGPTDGIAAFLQPYLQRGELRLIGEATPAELDACRRLMPGFADLFQVLPLAAFTRTQALAVLDRTGRQLEQNRKLTLAAGVTDRVYHLFRRFAPYEAFPGRAVAFLRSVGESKARTQARGLAPFVIDDRAVGAPEAPQGRQSIAKGASPGAPALTPADVVAAFSEQTGLPERFLRDELPLDRKEVLAAFRAQVIGQDEACAAAADLVCTFKAGLNDPQRPVGVLLFCGPTGVGKTEMAKALARGFFGRGDPAQPPDPGDSSGTDRLIRLDMSEFAGPDAVDRLLGPPHGEPSALIRRLRQQPFCALLLDEVEKAAPEVFDVLLGVFDEGRLTDRFGRVTTFRSAVIVLTSNLGAERSQAVGFRDRPAVRYADEAMKFFRPEFFNRLDAVVTFQPLPEDVIRAITRKEMEAVARREGLERAGLRLRPTERLVAKLAEEGFDARYGARPLQRTIERLVVAPLARWLLGQPVLRDAAVTADWGAEEATFHVG
jgi:ATP-dependent Clp protease ATP-binding subunit ClpC